ncbi:MAG: Uma2 family endonuclease [Candidatus Solibacter usitatus]|nr:Uma2 family endonuclease [Candidatus Solibacter usitatus]
MASQSVPLLTEEEYLAIERKAATKSEYFRGEMFAMSGGTYPHHVIAMNISGRLYSALEDRHCAVFAEGLRLRVSSSGLYTYPDVMVICGKPEFADGEKDTVTNPVLIFEVLSESTEDRDRGFKSTHYRSIPSVREFVIVSQTEPLVEMYRRQDDGTWIIMDIRGLDATVQFASLGCSLSMRQIYRNVEF